MKTTTAVAWLLGALLALASPASADREHDWRACFGDPGYTIDQRIAGCTAIIDAGGDSTKVIAIAYHNRGLGYAAKGEFGRAIRDYDQSLRLRPDDAETYYARAQAYDDMGQTDRAIQDFDQAIRLKPDYAAAYNDRGLAYHKKRLYDRAIEDYDEAIRLKPDYATAYNNRGISYAKKGQYDRAIADGSEAIRLRPGYANAYYNRGLSYFNVGQVDRAIADYDQAIRLAPDDPDPYVNRGVAYNNKGQYDTAIADFDRALALPHLSEPAKAFANRAYSYRKKGALRDLDRAIADGEQALKLDPRLNWARADLEEARRAKGALLAQAQAQGTGARIALVIGNSAYLAAPPLPNARNDAEDVANELKKLGYKIFGFPRTDFTKSELLLEMEAFKKAPIGAAAAVVWYSGHGQQMLEEGADNANDWIIPVDAKIATRADVAPNAVRLDLLKISTLAAKQLRMVVIDACRNSPFYTGTRATRGMGRGVPTPGVLLIQSTQPGNIAQDGQGRNSPFTQAFLAELRKGPNGDIRQLMSAVQGNVLGLTKGEQKPQIDDGLATRDTVALVP